MKGKTKLPLICFIAILAAMPSIFWACDTDECFDKNNYKTQISTKAAPGTVDEVQTDC
ncbi:MAG: hypothetical protein IJ250_04445 [Bacteroidales bacterium]|nr:hypothetical protein [Bacteroidales bacterium]